MSTAFIWPGALSECPLLDWSETPNRRLSSFEPEIGDPLERVRISHPGATIQATWHLASVIQKDALIAFRKAVGARPFSFVRSPFGPGRYKFASEPQIRRVGPTRFEAAIALRRLPG